MKHYFIDSWKKYKNNYVKSVINTLCSKIYDDVPSNITIDNIDLWDMAAVAFITVPDDYPHVKDFEEDHCGDQYNYLTSEKKTKRNTGQNIDQI